MEAQTSPAHHLWKQFQTSPSGHYLLAISGGADSTFLLHALAQKQQIKYQFSIAHLNHQTRGTDSKEDQIFVQELAKQYQLPFHTQQRDIPALTRTRQQSFELVAREERYGFFAEICAHHQLQGVVTAHHAGDQAESLMLHLLRGTGLEGLQGMAQRIQTDQFGQLLTIYRPMLNLNKNELLRWLKESHFPFREDTSNQEIKQTRNQIRKELLPLMQEINPKIFLHLNQLSQHAQELQSFLKPQVQEARKQLEEQGIDRTSTKVQVDLKQVLHISQGHSWLIKQLLQPYWLELKVGVDQQLTSEHLDLLALLPNRPNRTILTLPGSVHVQKFGERLTFKRSSKASFVYKKSSLSS